LALFSPLSALLIRSGLGQVFSEALQAAAPASIMSVARRDRLEARLMQRQPGLCAALIEGDRAARAELDHGSEDLQFHEAFADVVLADLGVEPDGLLERLLDPGAVPPPLMTSSSILVSLRAICGEMAFSPGAPSRRSSR